MRGIGLWSLKFVAPKGFVRPRSSWRTVALVWCYEARVAIGGES